MVAVSIVVAYGQNKQASQYHSLNGNGCVTRIQGNLKLGVHFERVPKYTSGG